MRCLQGTASSKKLSTIVELATAQIVDRSDTAGASASPASRTKLRCLNRVMVFSARASDSSCFNSNWLLRYVCCNMLPPCCECCNTLQHAATLFGLCCNMLPSAPRACCLRMLCREQLRVFARRVVALTVCACGQRRAEGRVDGAHRQADRIAERWARLARPERALPLHAECIHPSLPCRRCCVCACKRYNFRRFSAREQPPLATYKCHATYYCHVTYKLSCSIQPRASTEGAWLGLRCV